MYVVRRVIQHSFTPPRYLHANEDFECFGALRSIIIAVSHISLSVGQGALERAFHIGTQDYTSSNNTDGL
ncbi:hypothetical protein BOTCAL_0092g00160 [Botryotinia calthae]|uniref:Uncharacterized protein n=1 Tax=Botryotinia calthae TaxID=38488 RepID=A0A4Y8D735_9HELO|nr:hypothetical protein BOTCAL_0092g00160 [Botryotinia calthae]